MCNIITLICYSSDYPEDAKIKDEVSFEITYTYTLCFFSTIILQFFPLNCVHAAFLLYRTTILRSDTNALKLDWQCTEWFKVANFMHLWEFCYLVYPQYITSVHCECIQFVTVWICAVWLTVSPCHAPFCKRRNESGSFLYSHLLHRNFIHLHWVSAKAYCNDLTKQLLVVSKLFHTFMKLWHLYSSDRILRCDWSRTVQRGTTNWCKRSYQTPSLSYRMGCGHVRLLLLSFLFSFE